MSAAKGLRPPPLQASRPKVSPYELALDEAANADAVETPSPFELEVASSQPTESDSSKALMAAIEEFSRDEVQSAPAPEAAAAAPTAPKVTFDSRRPWPLGLPTLELALAAIVSDVEVDGSVEESHVRVLTLFPEWMFDEARTALGGGGNEVASAAASAWRAVVAFDRADQLVGVDMASLIALIDETVLAREKLVGASAFALDGGAASEELLSTLDECIGRFVVLARHHERARVKSVSEATKLLSVTAEPDGVKRKIIPMAFAVSVFFAVLFHVARLLVAPETDVWVVNGSLESGHATLVPGGPGASESALKSKISALRAQQVVATQGPDGQWYLAKEP